MKNARPWLIGAIATLLVVALAVWISRSIEWVDDTVVVPPSGEAERDRFYAAKQLATRLGARVTTLRSFERLPPPGATLVLASPRWAMFPGRDAALRRWVEDGGRLVALHGAWSKDGEAPAWVPIGAKRAPRTNDAASGNAAAASSDPLQTLRGFELASCHRYDEPHGSPGAFASPRSYFLCARAPTTLRARAAPLWRIANDVGIVAMRVAVGRGTVTSNALEGLFDNNAVVRFDGALAFAAMLELAPGDAVWFLVDETRAPLLKAMWQHGAPALVLAAAALALLLWRAATRFGPRMADPSLARRSIGEQVRRTAAFIAGDGGSALHRATVRALDDTARRSIAGYGTLVSARERSDAIAQKTGEDPAALAAAMTYEARRQRKNTALAIHRLERARRALAARTRPSVSSPASADASTP